MYPWLVAALCLLAALPASTRAEDSPIGASRKVVLVHGLLQGTRSMRRLSKQLTAAGHHVCNVAYPSRRHSIETLSRDYVRPAIDACFGSDAGPIDFVTHSLGGIVVRQLAMGDPTLEFGRVVMLAPPNGGSELVDKLGGVGLFKVIGGPAVMQLGTEANQMPHALGPAQFELGIIAGRRTVNPFLSLLIPGPDDGKVSIEHAKLEGMREFLVVPATHTFIMKNRRVQRQVRYFLEHGTFAEIRGHRRTIVECQPLSVLSMAY